MRCNCAIFSSTYISDFHFSGFSRAFMKGFGCLNKHHFNSCRTEATIRDWDKGREARKVWDEVTKDSSCYAYGEQCKYSGNLEKLIWLAAVEWRKRKDGMLPKLPIHKKGTLRIDPEE